MPAIWCWCRLAAAAFHSLGRHPLAGLAAGFSGVAAVFLVNVFVTPTDALLVEVTNDAIRTVNPAAQISVVGNLFFMIVSSIVMGIICTVLTERFVEPRLGRLHRRRAGRGGDRACRAASRLGLKYAGRALLGFVVVIGLLTAPPLPWGILRNQETGGIMAGSPFMSGLIILISLAVPGRGLCLWQGRGHDRQCDRGHRPDRQDLEQSGRDDLPAVRDRELHRLLQLHQPCDRAGGEPCGLPADDARSG